MVADSWGPCISGRGVAGAAAGSAGGGGGGKEGRSAMKTRRMADCGASSPEGNMRAGARGHVRCACRRSDGVRGKARRKHGAGGLRGLVGVPALTRPGVLGAAGAAAPLEERAQISSR